MCFSFDHKQHPAKRWWVILLPLGLAACASSGTDAPRVATQYSLTPAFTEIAISPGDPLALIEQELGGDEAEQFLAFIAELPPEHRRALLSVISQMDEGRRGVTTARHILPSPEYGKKFAELASLIGKDVEAGLAKELSRYFYGIWFGIQDAATDGMDQATLVEMIRFFSQGGLCLYDEQDLLAYQTSQFMIEQPVMLCDASVETLDTAWNYPPPAMINAMPAPEGEAPWQVQLMRAGKDRAYYHRPIRARQEMEKYGRKLDDWERDHVCGAVYIGERYALTAAHCVEGWDGYDDDFFDGRRIRAGSIDIGEGGEIIPINSVVIHASYRDGIAYRGYDIALLKLAREPSSPDTSRTRIPLYPRNNQKPGTELFQTGWGLTGATINSQSARDLAGNLQQSSRYLRIGKLQLLDDGRCNQNDAFKDKNVILGFGQICVGSDEGVDACKGDSGGPLVRMVEGELPILVGLVSWGIGCGYESRPAIYTDVGSFYNWIKQAKLVTKSGKIVRPIFKDEKPARTPVKQNPGR